MLRKNGRLVVVTPYIVTRSGQAVTMPIGEKLEALGFRRVQPFDENNFSEDVEGLDELVEMRSLIENG